MSCTTLLELLAAQPADSVAVLQFSRSAYRELTYADLSRDALRLAAGLTDLDVSPGDRVLFYAPGGLEWIVACMGAVQAGTVVVPVDAQLRGRELDHVLHDADPSVIFTVTGQVQRLREHGVTAPLYVLDGDQDDETYWTALLARTDFSLPERTPGDTAALFYTSGTTGRPKGVPLTHANLCFQIRTIIGSGLTGPGDRMLLPLPMHHVYPFVVGMLAPLSLGLTIILPSTLTGPELARAMGEGRATVVMGVPRLYKALLDGISAKVDSSGRAAAALFRLMLASSIRVSRHTPFQAGKYLFAALRRRVGPNLRILASGGSPLEPDLAWKLEGLGWDVAIGYGLTETSPLLTINPPGHTRIGSVGRIVPDMEVRIAPLEKGEESGAASPQDLPCADWGEVQARGPGVFSGYYRLEEKTRDAFTPDGWFRTGDLGCLDHGWLYLAGRASTMIVTSGGENIQPDTVEEALERSPLLREAAVFQENGRLTALAVPQVSEIRRRGLENEQQAVRDAVKERSRDLPSYQRVVDVVVTRTPLPRTRLGKIRRHLLQYLAEKARGSAKNDGRPRELRPQDLSDEDRALLENPEGKAVWDMLRRRLPDRALTPDMSPQYDLGIDSLEWLNLTLEIRDRTGVEIDEAAIARIDTVRDLLTAVVGAEKLSGEGRGDPLADPESALSDVQKRWLEPRTRAMRRLGRILQPLIAGTMRLLFKVRAHGLEEVSGNEPLVLAPNHGSYLDPFALGAVLDLPFLERTCWGGWTGVVANGPIRRYLSRTGRIVPIDPQRSAMSSLAFGAAVLRRGDNLVWFPEGQRTTTGEMLPFKPGLGMILERYPVRVVPVAITGAFHALPPGRFLPRLTPITVRFGKAVDVQTLKEEGEGNTVQERIMHALHGRVRNMVEETSKK